MSQGQYEIRRAGDGWYWRLVASNGEVLAHSESYSSKDGAVEGIEAAKRANKEGDEANE